MEKEIYNTPHERDIAKRRAELMRSFEQLKTTYPGKSMNWYCTALASTGKGGLFSRSQVRRVLVKCGASTSA